MKNGGWLDQYADGGTMQEHQENYNDASVSLPEGFVGMGNDTSGRNYSPAWGGQFEDGGEIPIAQTGKATRADSLDIYNRSLKIDAYYNNLKKKGWYPKREIYPVNNLSSKALEAEMKDVDKESRKTYKEQSMQKRDYSLLKNMYPNMDPKKANLDALAEHIRLTKGTRYATKDNLPNIIDPMAPTTVIDTRIIPKELVSYETIQGIKEAEFYEKYPNPTEKQLKKYEEDQKKLERFMPPSGSAVNLYRYDPLSVKPWDMLTDEEKKLRVKKYGTDGVPKSYLDKNKPTKTKQTEKPIYEDKPQDRKPITPVANNLQLKGLVSDGLELDTNLPELRPQVTPVKDWKYIWKHAGSKEQGYITSPEDMDYWVDKKDWYTTGGGKDKGDSVEIIPQYQMGGYVYPVNYVPQAQDGTELSEYDIAMRGMMKSKIGMGNAFGNPAIKRMSQAMPKTGMTPEGIGTHYMGSMDNYAVPLLQDFGGDELRLVNPNTRSREAIRFNSPEEAQYFAEHYKDVAPMSTIYKGLQEYAMGGSIPGAVGFTYARVGAPSKGPRRNQTDVTDASAQNGQEMKYYQEGLDYQPKTISKNGGWLNKYDVAQDGQEISEPTIQGGVLEDVVIQGKPTEFGALRGKLKKQNTWEDYAQRYLGNFEKNMGQTIDNLPEYRKQEYEDYINKLAFDEYVKTHPQAKGEKRGAYIDRIQAENAKSPNFERAYEANAQYNDATDFNKWRKGLIGLGSLVMGPGAINDLKQTSGYFSTKEKQDLIENPILSNIDTTLGTLEPLTIPVEGIYGNKSFGDIASGQSADIPMSARLLGDPLMLGFEAAPLIGAGFRTAGRLLGTEEGLLSNAYRLNPNAERLNDINKSYRVAGLDALEDFNNTGVLRSQRILPENPTFLDRMQARPTSFPSFQKGYADLTYLPEEGGVIFETSLPTFKRGQVNPVTGDVIGGRHYAHRVIDPETGRVMTEIPGSNINVYGDKPHWWQGYKQLDLPGRNYFEGPLPIIPRNNMIQSSPIDSALEKELRPYISRIGEPSISREEEVFRNVMGPQYREAKELQNTKFLDSEGNIISNPNTSQQQFYYGETPITDRPIQKDGGVIKDDMGQWAHPGEITEIGSNQITMQGVPYPVLGVSDTGDVQMMYPEEEYEFDGESVTEFPIAKNGLRQEQKGLVNLDNLTNFTNYNTKQPGGWLDKYN
jgi:hypothetical protein